MQLDLLSKYIGKECVLFEGGMGTAVKIINFEEDNSKLYLDIEVISKYGFVSNHYSNEKNKNYIKKWFSENIGKTSRIFTVKEYVSVSEKRECIVFLLHLGGIGNAVRLFYNNKKCIDKIKRKEPFSRDELWKFL